MCSSRLTLNLPIIKRIVGSKETEKHEFFFRFSIKMGVDSMLDEWGWAKGCRVLFSSGRIQSGWATDRDVVVTLTINSFFPYNSFDKFSIFPFAPPSFVTPRSP